MVENDSSPVIAAIVRVVRLSTRHAWVVIPAFLIAAVLAGVYVSRHIAINTDSSKLLSSSLPWRQQEEKLNQLFPQRTDLMIAVIDGATPEAADEAADALVGALAKRKDVVRTVYRPDGGEFFARNGILFLSVAEVQRNMDELIKAEPFLGTLAADPTLRGVLGAISQSLEGVRLKKTTLEDIRPAVSAIADALEGVERGQHPAFSWRRLISGRAPEQSDLRRFVNMQPVLNYGDLEPGGQATKIIRATIAKLGLTPDRGVRVRLTGSVPLADEEFATIADGAALNGVVTVLRRSPDPVAGPQAGPDHPCGFDQSRGGLEFHRRGRPDDGRRAEPHLGRLRRAVHRPWRRLRHPVQRPLSRGAVCGPPSAGGSRTHRAWRGSAASACRGLDRGRFLLVSADRLCGSLRTRADRRDRHDHRVPDHGHPAAGAARRAQTGRRAGAGRLGVARAARPFSRSRAQLGRRPYARRRHSWPAAAARPAIRLQPAEPALEKHRSRSRPCSI